MRLKNSDALHKNLAIWSYNLVERVWEKLFPLLGKHGKVIIVNSLLKIETETSLRNLKVGISFIPSSAETSLDFVVCARSEFRPAKIELKFSWIYRYIQPFQYLPLG